MWRSFEKADFKNGEKNDEESTGGLLGDIDPFEFGDHKINWY